jgi:hypothetical protein
MTTKETVTGKNSYPVNILQLTLVLAMGTALYFLMQGMAYIAAERMVATIVSEMDLPKCKP